MNMTNENTLNPDNNTFVHLHLHSEYSLLDGACRIEEIPKAAREAGHGAVAITDHGVMYGVVEFYRACIAEGIKPIIGCEVYVSPRTRFDKAYEFDYEKYHLVLLVKNEIGYKNLIYMVSKSFTEGFYSKPSVDMELLAQYHEGLIALSACLGGYIPKAIINNAYMDAENCAVNLNNIFGQGNFYLEIQNHFMEDQKKVNSVIKEISENTGIPLVATNDVHYIKRTDADTQAVLMCIQTNNVITDGRPLGFETDEFYYKSTDEMNELFPDSQYKDAVLNTGKIADMCSFDFNFKKTYLPVFKTENGKSPKEYLYELVYNGLQYRVNNKNIVYSEKYTEEDYKYRIEYELTVISTMGYAEYFLIVWDFVNYAKNNLIPTGPGRGSGAGSLVAYLLKITDIDPIKYGLLFEAFLNPERISMPDFDIDFCYDRRDEVIRYVINKYGADHVAQIITFGTMAARAAVRDVGRALGVPYNDIDIIAKLIPHRIGITIKEAIDENPDLKKIYESSDTGSGTARNILDIAISLEGMPRHSSTHAAGIVITDKPVYTYVPLAGHDEILITQFDMDTIALLGLLKFDFLALRYLTIISDTEKSIKEIEPDFNISNISLADTKVFEMISQGHTDGLFQLESGGMRQMLVNLKPNSIEDIMVSIALYRPGPMDAIPKFIEHRNNTEELQYKIPQLKEILDETCGCIVYQEQVMQIFRAIAGYTYGKADIVRRAISKKKAGVIEKELGDFLIGTAKKGITKEDALELFNDMTGFANYGFKKSHAAAYAVISYQTAYLKYHYTQMYLAALLTSVLGDNIKTAQYIAECGRCGIKVLPPDINESKMLFSVSGNDIRFGLLAIKNVGQAFITQILNEREKSKFNSFTDFIVRMAGYDINRRQTESLIYAGAFDNLGVYRSRLLASYDKLITSQTEKNKKNIAGQLDLFDTIDNTGTGIFKDFQYPVLPELALKEKLAMEKENTGMFFSGHMLDDYSKHIELLNPTPINNVLEAFDNTSDDIIISPLKEHSIITIAGIITKRFNKTTKNGENMAFIIIEDRYSEIEAVVFPKIYLEFSQYMAVDNAVLITGEITVKEEEAPKILVKNADLLKNNNSFKQTTETEMKLYLRVPDTKCAAYKRAVGISEIFTGNVPVIFYDDTEKKYIKIKGLNVTANDFVLKELKEVLGEANVIYK